MARMEGVNVSLSVKTRFEVFKRDRYQCQYCGKSPPDVLLEADHIIPKAAGGSDAFENLTTACKDCNRGKGAGLLEEGTAPLVNRVTVEELAERVDQAKAYMELLGGLSSLVDRQIGMVVDGWAHAFGAKAEEREGGTFWRLPKGGVWPNEPTIRRFLRALPLADILEAVDIAASKFYGQSEDGACRYFYGICHRAIKQGGSVSVRPEPEPEPIDVAALEQRAWEAGAMYESQRIRHYFLARDEYGLETFADVFAALWPEAEE